MLRRRGLRLEYLTIAWNALEAVVAVAAGLAAGSIALVGFGLDSLIEVFAAGVVVWELKGIPAARERRALKAIALSFFALAAYVTAESVRDLVIGVEPAESPVGIALAIVSLMVMPLLAFAKRRTGRSLGSSPLVADSSETWLCACLSAILLAGLVINAVLGWWWADPIAALVIAALATREGWRTWHGDPCC
jgi:divalent metal cation (Fe/Co/Zn/Cd) transporter